MASYQYGKLHLRAPQDLAQAIGFLISLSLSNLGCINILVLWISVFCKGSFIPVGVYLCQLYLHLNVKILICFQELVNLS